jgi:hypothetical protein
MSVRNYDASEHSAEVQPSAKISLHEMMIEKSAAGMILNLMKQKRKKRRLILSV